MDEQDTPDLSPDAEPGRPAQPELAGSEEQPAITPPPAPWQSSLRTTLIALARLLGRGWRMAQLVLQGDGYSPLEDVRSAFAHLNPRRILLALSGLAILAYLLSGIYTVQPGEAAVVRRFGRVVTPLVTEGLHYRLPWPIEQEDVVNIAEIRRESVGLTEAEPEHPLHLEDPGKLQVLSGDTNIVDYEVIVQYQVRDPTAYLFNLNYPSYQVVRDAVRAAVTRVSGSTGVDEILTSERQSLQNALRETVQALLDQYDSGLAVISVSLQKAYPPDEVADTFRDVSSAREDKARTVNEAESYRNSIIPQARGQAERVRSEGGGYALTQVNQATGAAQSFSAILQEYQTNSKIYGEAVTRFRLHLETMERVMPRVKTYVVQRGERINLRLLNGGQVNTFPPVPGQ
ncbi:MAG: FtsH protease activity modulator HflK [Caldilineaceae bacterium]|nr:FtsH protease activity modulator HflK [Caldilineaceae bacterium]